MVACSTNGTAVTDSLTDCQSNEALIRGLWGTNLVISLVFFVLVHMNMSKLWKKHNSLAKEARTRGSRYSVYQNKGLFANIPYAYFGMTAQIAFAILKLIDPNMHIGLSWGLTVLWWIQRTCFYFAGDTFQPNLLASLLRTQRGLENVTKWNFRASYLHFFIATGIQVTALPPLLMGNPSVFNPTTGLVSVGAQLNVYALAMLFLMVESYFLKIKVIQILDHSYSLTKDAKTKRIRDKLSKVQDEMVKHAFTQFFLYLVFGVLPFTWRFHDYLLACSWIFVPIAANGLTKSIVQQQEKRSTGTRGSIDDTVESPGPAAALASDRRPHSPSDDPANDNKPMYVHGLELEPKQSTVVSSLEVYSQVSDGVPLVASPKESSSAKRLLRALTPSSRNKANNKNNEFEVEEATN